MVRTFKIYDAFPDKRGAIRFALTLRKMGSKARVKKLIPPQAGGRLKWGVYTDDSRLV